MKSWPWRSIFGSIGGVLFFIGITPLVYLLWFGTAHNFEPLSAPISLKHGSYTSPYFKADLDEDYQVEIYFVPHGRTPLDLDWKIVDERGTPVQSAVYTEDQHMAGNVAILTSKYRPTRGLAYRIILNIHQDVQAKDRERPLQPTDTRLHVGVPERSLEQAYGTAAAMVWAAGIAGLGAIFVFFFLVLRAMRPKVLPGSNPQPGSSR